MLQLLGIRGEKPTIHKKTKESIEGIFPVYTETLSKLESMMVIKEGIPVPAPGMDSGYDKLMEEIYQVKGEFQALLERTRKRFNCQGITFVHLKQRYELEIPEHLVEGTKKPKEYTLTSKKKGYVRFHTQEILDLIEKLEEMELRLHKVILPFIVKCFKEFYSHNSTWQEVIQCLGELDCLASLAQLAKTMPLSCRPQFAKGQIFNLKGVVHPLVAMRSAEFIRNDVELEEGQKVFLITGPNMGGKSTLMRSVCIATIMAQMGSFVAAESFTLSVKDRIFTRIGASDNIFEGKSTFFVELEETLNIITEATKESLVIIDELGRGTSTYDGMAIAYAVLKDLAENIGCLCFFATHFHLLLEDFKLFKTVIMYYMDSEFFEDELVRFLYKFKKGSVGNSFGLSVARFAGLPLSVVEKARKRAADMTKELVSVQQFKEITGKFGEIIMSLENDGKDIDDVIKKLANL